MVVKPQYRLVPQIHAAQAFLECEDACVWAKTVLPSIMADDHGLQVDIGKVVAMGYSSGGTLALHLASLRLVKAVTAVGPAVFLADTSTEAHHATSELPFGSMPNFVPSEAEWEGIKPAGVQLCGAPVRMPGPGVVLGPREKWVGNTFKHGQWAATLAPDGDYSRIAPKTRLHRDWPPVTIIHGGEDRVPGRSVELIRRAEREMKDVEIDVQAVIVANAGHLFDHNPAMGTTELGEKWKAVVQGLEWLEKHLE